MCWSFPRASLLQTAGIDLAALAQTSKLIRWSSKSQIGTEIEQHLRRLRIELPRRFEFDLPIRWSGSSRQGLAGRS